MPRRRINFVLVTVLAAAAGLAAGSYVLGSSGYTVVAWNDLGMHCMDSDYSVFAILPPYNNLHAQLLDPQGHLVTSPAGVTLSYEGVEDPTGSINTTSAGKTGFWTFAPALFGATSTPDMGLAGNAMPGAGNVPQPMTFSAALSGWHADGIPITPYDDAGHHRPYPLMRVVARNGQGQLLASAQAVLPVSDELDCSACHASGAGPDAQPAAGWAFEANADRDYRLNILQLHDEKSASSATFGAALASNAFNPAGLHATVVQDAHPILCASCHATNALGTPGFPGVKPVTESMHAFHGHTIDPTSGLTLESSENRAACYRCHPGSTTRCLRGAMGAAVAPDGELAMQCQSCHGPMSAVGAADRAGWLDEPNCQACHTGTATHNNGQIRYTDALLPSGELRIAVDSTFATNPDTPAAGFSLYKLSFGHGGLRCEACHGSTHAEYPGLHPNDNLQTQATQKHVGMLVECGACHSPVPNTSSGGPHGMHPVGPGWVSSHGEGGGGDAPSTCQDCHGTDLRGTVLSVVKADRTLAGKAFFRGEVVGCWSCHDGPGSENMSANKRPVVQGGSIFTSGGTAASATLHGSDGDGDPLVFRLLSQPQHGRVALDGSLATYDPDPGFAGTESFTFTASDGSIDALPGSIAVTRGGEWAAYGTGYAGSGGAVPALAFSGDPTLGALLQVSVGNTSGQPTVAWIYAAAEPASRATLVGGRLLVEPATALIVDVSAAGSTLAQRLPADTAFLGGSLYLQAIVQDAGAPHGWAFTPALRVTPGP